MIEWIKNNKVVVINILVILIAAIHGAITQNLFPNWVVYLTWVVGILDMIRIALLGQQLTTLKAKLAKIGIDPAKLK